MLLDQLLQLIHLHAVAVDGRTDQIGAVKPEALDGGQKGRPLHDGLAARIDQALAQQIERLLAAGGDDQLVGGHIFGALGLHELRQLLAQRLVALGGAVLQRGPGLGGQRLVGGLADAVDVEHRAVRKAACKTDDAGLAQQLEQFADGGGFDVLQALGEMERHG